MKVGDLVYHKEDIKDGDAAVLGPVPGLIMAITANPREAVVYFTDRTFSEYHLFEDLIRVEVYEYNEKQRALTR